MLGGPYATDNPTRDKIPPEILGKAKIVTDGYDYVWVVDLVFDWTSFELTAYTPSDHVAICSGWVILNSVRVVHARKEVRVI